MPESVKVEAGRRNRRHPLEFKLAVVLKSFESGVSVASVALEHGINANQLWSWRKLYAGELLSDREQADTMLPVAIEEQRLAQPTTAADQAGPRAEGGSICFERGNISVKINRR